MPRPPSRYTYIVGGLEPLPPSFGGFGAIVWVRGFRVEELGYRECGLWVYKGLCFRL